MSVRTFCYKTRLFLNLASFFNVFVMNALLKFLCIALHSVVPNGDTYPKLSMGYSMCFNRISFSLGVFN